jgi:hypothetical protein
MLYVQQFQHSRQHQIEEYQRLRSAADHNFLLCSNQYAEKLKQSSRPGSRATTPNSNPERTRTLLILTRISSSISLNKNNNNELSILNLVSEKKVIV